MRGAAVVVALGLASGCAGCGASEEADAPARPAVPSGPGAAPQSVPFGEPPRAFVACLRHHGVEPPEPDSPPPAGGPDAKMRRALDACAGELPGTVGGSPPSP